MQAHYTTAGYDDPNHEDVNDQEYADFCEVVGESVVTCPATTIQTAVTTAKMVLKQDWRQEARKFMRLHGLSCYAPLMTIHRDATTARPA